MTKKLLMAAIALSLTGHLLFLGLSGFIDLSGHGTGEGPLILDLAEEPPALPQKNETIPPARNADGRKDGAPAREDTVTLTGGDSKYRDYLLAVKREIEEHWAYPQEALERSAAGTVVLKFAIAADGNLADSGVLESSGEEVLDREALRVIRAAAPYQPLPRSFQLARLNIVARFQYEMDSL